MQTEPPPTPTPRRRAQKKMTDGDKAMLAEVLRRPDVRVDGKINIPLVAILTGLNYQQVSKFVNKDPYMAAQVGEVNPGRLVPEEADLVDAKVPSAGITISNAQFEEYRSMIRQNRKMLASDWVGLGMTEAAGERMQQACTLGTAPMSMILRVTTGQLISNMQLLDEVNKADAARILDNKLPDEKNKDGTSKDKDLVEREWRHTLFAGLKLQLEMFSHVHKAQALMARVMRELYLMNGGSAPPPEKGVYETKASSVPSGVSDRPA